MYFDAFHAITKHSSTLFVLLMRRLLTAEGLFGGFRNAVIYCVASVSVTLQHNY